MKNKEKLKRKLLILSLLLSLNSTITPLKVYANENNTTSEIENSTGTDSITDTITYYSNVYNINEAIIYDTIDALSTESEEEIIIDKDYVENVTKDLYYNSTKYGYNLVDISKDNEKSIPELITYYSNVFGIEESSIYDSLDAINNETDEDIVIDELKILNIARELYYSGNYSKKEKVENMNLAPEYMVEKYANLIGVNKEVAMSIVYTECGYSVNSSNYLNNNNPAGLGPHMFFENKEIGIIYFINMLKNSYGCTENSNSGFFPAVASTYCENPEHWISLCSGNYSSIINNYYSHRPDYIKDEKTLKLQ